MSSFARSALLWLAAAAVKGQDELAAVGLDGPSRQPKEHQISGQRRTLDMNLPTQTPLTRAGLFMEDQSAHSGALSCF
jgi:hypothetical protein